MKVSLWFITHLHGREIIQTHGQYTIVIKHFLFLSQGAFMYIPSNF